MKVVLLALGGDVGDARAALGMRYPQAEIEVMQRAEIEHSSMGQRLAALRARRPDIFAVSTERLVWQRGQNAFLLFGALAGARRSIMLDAHGGVRDEGRGRILLRGPTRLTREAAISSLALSRAWRQLRGLERAVKNEIISTGLRTRRDAKNKEAVEIVYLRATPGPGLVL